MDITISEPELNHDDALLSAGHMDTSRLESGHESSNVESKASTTQDASADASSSQESKEATSWLADIESGSRYRDILRHSEVLSRRWEESKSLFPHIWRKWFALKERMLRKEQMMGQYGLCLDALETDEDGQVDFDAAGQQIRAAQYKLGIRGSDQHLDVVDNLAMLEQIWLQVEDGLEDDDFATLLSYVLDLPKPHLKVLFMKMDADSDGSLTWDEYLSYLLREVRHEWNFSNAAGTWHLREMEGSVYDTRALVQHIVVVPSETHHSSAATSAQSELGVRHPLINHNGLYIVSCRDNTVQIWDSATMTRAGMLPLRANPIRIRTKPRRRESSGRHRVQTNDLLDALSNKAATAAFRAAGHGVSGADNNDDSKSTVSGGAGGGGVVGGGSGPGVSQGKDAQEAAEAKRFVSRIAWYAQRWRRRKAESDRKGQSKGWRRGAGGLVGESVLRGTEGSGGGVGSSGSGGSVGLGDGEEENLESMFREMHPVGNHTCVAYYPPTQEIIVAMMDRTLHFFGQKDRQKWVLTDLWDVSCLDVPQCMHVHRRKGSSNYLLFLGDTTGHLAVFDIASKRRLTDESKLAVSYHGGHSVRQLLYIDDVGLVSCGMDGRVCITTPLGKKEPRYLSGHTRGVYFILHCQRPHKCLISVGFDRRVILWDLYRCAAIGELEGSHSQICGIVANEKRNQIVTCCIDKKVRVYDIRTYKCIQQLVDNTVHTPDRLSTLVFDAERQRMVTCGSQMRLWATQIAPGNKSRRGGPAHDNLVAACLYSQVFSALITVSVSEVVRLWNIHTGKSEFEFTTDHGSPLTAACLDPAGRRLITAAHDGTAKVWNFNNGGNLHEFEPNSMEIRQLLYLENTMQSIVGVGWDKAVVRWPDPSCKHTEKERHIEHAGDVLSITATGQHLASSDSLGHIVMWYVDSGRFLKRFLIPITPAAPAKTLEVPPEIEVTREVRVGGSAVALPSAGELRKPSAELSRDRGKTPLINSTGSVVMGSPGSSGGGRSGASKRPRGLTSLSPRLFGQKLGTPIDSAGSSGGGGWGRRARMLGSPSPKSAGSSTSAPRTADSALKTPGSSRGRTQRRRGAPSVDAILPLFELPAPARSKRATDRLAAAHTASSKHHARSGSGSGSAGGGVSTGSGGEGGGSATSPSKTKPRLRASSPRRMRPQPALAASNGVLSVATAQEVPKARRPGATFIEWVKFPRHVNTPAEASASSDGEDTKDASQRTSKPEETHASDAVDDDNPLYLLFIGTDDGSFHVLHPRSGAFLYSHFRCVQEDVLGIATVTDPFMPMGRYVMVTDCQNQAKVFHLEWNIDGIPLERRINGRKGDQDPQVVNRSILRVKHIRTLNPTCSQDEACTNLTAIDDCNFDDPAHNIKVFVTSTDKGQVSMWSYAGVLMAQFGQSDNKSWPFRDPKALMARGASAESKRPGGDSSGDTFITSATPAGGRSRGSSSTLPSRVRSRASSGAGQTLPPGAGGVSKAGGGLAAALVKVRQHQDEPEDGYESESDTGSDVGGTAPPPATLQSALARSRDAVHAFLDLTRAPPPAAAVRTRFASGPSSAKHRKRRDSMTEETAPRLSMLAALPKRSTLRIRREDSKRRALKNVFTRVSRGGSGDRDQLKQIGLYGMLQKRERRLQAHNRRKWAGRRSSHLQSASTRESRSLRILGQIGGVVGGQQVAEESDSEEEMDARMRMFKQAMSKKEEKQKDWTEKLMHDDQKTDVRAVLRARNSAQIGKFFDRTPSNSVTSSPVLRAQSSEAAVALPALGSKQPGGLLGSGAVVAGGGSGSGLTPESAGMRERREPPAPSGTDSSSTPPVGPRVSSQSVGSIAAYFSGSSQGQPGQSYSKQSSAPAQSSERGEWAG